MVIAKTTSLTGQPLLYILIGHGLVGNAISEQLSGQAQVLQHYSIDWRNISSTTEWIASQDLTTYACSHIEVVWAAGKAGFSATADQTAIELLHFKQIIGAIKAITAPLQSVRWWMISSAGGLFEGQTLASRDTVPNPKRPYGMLKLDQETYLLKEVNYAVICRLSSVYSAHNLSGRLGLIPVLMKNCLQNSLTTLVGSESTVRDYVLDKDIGRFVAKHILQQSTLSGVQHLVEGRPHSILQLKQAIENMLAKKLLIKYSIVQHNSANITFARQMRSESFLTTPMPINLKCLYNNLLAHSPSR